MAVAEIIRKLYFNSYVRIPVKFILSFWFFKVGYDYYQYRTAWRVKGAAPRSQLFHGQSPLTPPFQSPYPYYQTYEQYKHLKAYYRVMNTKQKLQTIAVENYFVHFDSPYRENVNAIDRFLLRGKEHSTSEKNKFYLLNQLAKKEGQVPQGVYQEIRKVREYELDAQKTIVPQL